MESVFAKNFYRMVCVIPLRTPFKVLNMIITWVPVFVVYRRIVIWIWNKQHSNKPMDIESCLYAIL